MARLRAWALLTGLGLGGGGMLTAGSAWACSSWYGGFEIDSDLQDQTPPAAPSSVEVTKVRRAAAPERDGCAMSKTSCDDVAQITLAVAPAPDGEELGYDFELVGGELPENLSLRPDPYGTLDHQIYLSWSEQEDYEAFSFELAVRAVDRAGNRSLEATRVKVRSAGSGGCSSFGAGRELGGLVLLGLVLWRLRGPAARVRA